MYAAPPPPPITTTPVVDAAPRRGGLGAAPLLAICCLAFILLLIASTIVLSLIPIYLPAKGTVGDGLTRAVFFRLTPNMTLGNDGTLDDNNRIIISRALATQLGFPAASLFLSPIVLVTSSKRKRRGLVLARSRRQGGTQRGYCSGQFRRDECGFCRIRFFRLVIVVVLFIGGQFLVIEFIVEIFLFAIPIPPGLPPSTAAIASTSSTAAASSGATTANTGSSISSTTPASTSTVTGAVLG